MKTTTLIIETLTHTAIANLNRDDLGEVKRAGDRIRVSSQCIKRNVRLLMNELLEGKQNAVRSKHIPSDLIARAVNEGVTEEQAKKASIAYFGSKNIDPKTNELKTLVFLSSEEIDGLYEGFKAACADPKDKNLKGHLEVLKEGSNRYGLVVSLFGRMFADDVSLNVEGAAAFKHPYTVQAQEAEKDFFTAVDDKQEHGSGHLGVTEFASGDFYGCIHLNLDLLATNLGMEKSDEEFKELVEKFLKASILAFPKAKHNSNLANNLPYFVQTRLVEGFASTNDDAYATPIPTYDQGKIIGALQESQSNKDKMYKGTAYTVKGTWSAHNTSVETLIEETIKNVG